jgi:hypothetical protein
MDLRPSRGSSENLIFADGDVSFSLEVIGSGALPVGGDLGRMALSAASTG